VPADTSGIDRFFDFIDNAVDKADRVLNRTKYTEEQHQARNAKIIDADATEVRKPAPPSSTAIARRPSYRIEEMIDALTGQPIWIVTDGRNQTECNSLELALKIKSMLEQAP